MAVFSLLVVATWVAASAFTPGCLITGQRFIDGTLHNATHDGPGACQNACAGDATCNGFTFYPASSQCWFSALGAAEKLTRQQDGVTAYSGPKRCTVPPAACPATLTGAWPGRDVAASNAAFNTGYQPASLQCWPSNVTNTYGPCSEVKTLDELNMNGWPGLCLGLRRIELGPGEDCEATCLADVECPMYQVGSDGSCWMGLGEGCYDQAPWSNTWTPQQSKRFQRGAVHVVKEFSGVQLLGLKQVFDRSNLEKMGMETAKAQCAHACYSFLTCQYWQLNKVSGCWIEESNPKAYPLTENDVEYNTADANNTVAGEFIQRVCTPAIPTVPPVTTISSIAPMTSASTTISTTTTTTTTGAAGGFPWWGWLLLALLLLSCICGIVAFILGSTKPKKAKKSKRALRPNPPPVQQPVPTMQTAMPVYYAAPASVYTAAPPQPMYTYTAPAAMPVASMAVAAPMTATRGASLQVSPAAMTQQPTSQFDMIDRNGDGVITRAEFQAAGLA